MCVCVCVCVCVYTSAPTGRHLFDKRMFQLLWSPAVSAMCGIIDNVRREAVLESALTGLTLASTVASVHNLDDVADTIMSNLAKIPMQVRVCVCVCVQDLHTHMKPPVQHVR